MAVNSPHKDALRTQIREAYGRVVYSYTTHLKMMNCLDDKNRLIHYVQIILSAISTGGFIGAIVTNETILTCIGGLFSTALLALNLFFKEFNLLAEIQQHRVTSDELWMVREDYVSLLTDFETLNEAQIMEKRDSLQRRTYEIYKKGPKTDSKSYTLAKQALKSDEEQFFTSDELDKMLPEHLRVKRE